MSLWIFRQIKVSIIASNNWAMHHFWMCSLHTWKTLILIFVICVDRSKKINLSYIFNQPSVLNLQTLVFNIKLIVSLILLSGHLFYPNNCFDFWSRIHFGIWIRHIISRLACLNFSIVNFINSVWFVERMQLLTSAFLKNGNV